MALALGARKSEVRVLSSRLFTLAEIHMVLFLEIVVVVVIARHLVSRVNHYIDEHRVE